TDGVPIDYLRGMLQACVREAMQASDPVEQLQRFATQLSLRLIWMERAHPKIFAPAVTSPAAGPEPSPTLSEVTRVPLAVVSETKLPFFARWKSAGIIAASAVAGLLAIILLGRTFLRWHRRRMRNSIWLLPEVETKPRYG